MTSRSVTSQVVRGFCLLALGLMLVCYSQDAPKLLVQLVGLAVLLPGIASLLMLLRGPRTRAEAALFPVLGVAAVVLGLLLLCWPSVFVDMTLYVVAALLIFCGLMQTVTRWRMVSLGIPLSGASFLIPLLLIVAGAFIFFRPDLAAPLPFVVLGAAYVLYALMELWSAWQLRQYYRNQPDPMAEEVGTADDTPQVIQIEASED